MAVVSQTPDISGDRQSGQDVRTQNVVACQAVANIVKTSLGPVGLDKMLVDDIGDVTITNDGATILKMLEVEHPAAKVLVELAELQDREVGDGTTSVVIVAAELLKRANGLVRDHLHPTSIIGGYRLAMREACKYVEEKLSVKVEKLGKDSLINCAKTSMSSKLIAGDSDFFANLVVDAVQAVKMTNARGEVKYPIKGINILKAHGKSARDSFLMNGYALDTGRAAQGMPLRVAPAKIACLDFNLQKTKMQLGIQVLVNDPRELEKIRQREADMTKERIEKLLKAGANVVLTTKGIDDMALKVFPCDHSLNSTPAEQKKTEMEFTRLLNVAEKTYGLFFSYDSNLTLSAQRLNDLGEESRLLPLWRQAEPRFLWNNYMLEVLIDNKLDPYLLPVVQGSFHHFQAAIGKDIIDITLIARRCTRRNGTRMWRRGADPDGYVANFVETEQIMQFNGYTASFVQVRGSIPLLWEQIVDLTYKPKFELLKLEEAPRVLERHFLDLRKKYGAVLVVDLVNKHGGEGRLCEKFGSTIQHVGSDDVRYLHFDFHHICGHIHFERLSILYDQISDFLERNGYLLLNEKGEKMKEQLGVVRTNCIDCLDRTNVTQSMIGRNMLEYQLRRLGVFGAEETISSHPNLDESFKILWANHGDDISVQYSGTPALKGDFVRLGHRTVQGILTDGWNALMRYYLNNFCDGTKQDAIDILQGHYIVSVGRDISPSSQNGGLEAIASFPLALALVLTGFLFATMSLRQVRYDFRHLFFSLMWASISVGIAAFVRANGRLFCNRPRLHKPRR